MSINIFITTHNRVTTLCQALDSILKQDVGAYFDVTVFDNSDNNETKKKVKDSYKDVKYVCNKGYSQSENFASVFDHISEKYFMIFHDDDIMYDGLVYSLYSKIEGDESIVASGSNALCFNEKNNGSIISYTPSFISMSDIKITSQNSLIKKYFLGNGVCPFPFYMYRSKVIVDNGIRLTSIAGKYSDVMFLLQISKLGSVYWLSKPRALYRIHDNNDSSTFNANDRNKLLDLAVKNTKYSKKSILLKLYLLHLPFNTIVNYLKNGDVYNNKVGLKYSMQEVKHNFFTFFFYKDSIKCYFQNSQVDCNSFYVQKQPWYYKFS